MTKAATTKKSRGHQTTRSANADSSSLYTRRKVAEIRRDAKVDHTTPLPYLRESERSDREYDGEVEVARTEPCSPALRAQIMAAVGQRESPWTLERWSPGHEEGPSQVQDGLYSAVTWHASSIPQEPHLPYPLVSSIWPNPPSQGHPEAVPPRVRALEGLLSHSSAARTQSPVPRPPRRRPQSLQMPYSPPFRSLPPFTHSALSTVTPPPTAVSTSFTPPRPSVLSRSMSWIQYPTAEQAVPAYASRPEPPTHLLQAPSQQGYFGHYPDSNRTSEPSLETALISIAPQSTVSNHPRRTQRNPCTITRHSILLVCTTLLMAGSWSTYTPLPRLPRRLLPSPRQQTLPNTLEVHPPITRHVNQARCHQRGSEVSSAPSPRTSALRFQPHQVTTLHQ